MKKLVSLWITILMVGLMTAASWAATEEIAVTQVLGSSNTAPTGPVGFLVDGDPGTAWVTSQETPGPAWAVLQLKETARVDGIQLYGPCYGKLTVEYWQDNGWHSFLAARSIDAMNNSGWNLIDLSYDRVATDKIRLSLTSDQGMKLGGIGEIKVLGRSAADMLQRLEPVQVSTSSRTQYGYPSTYLFDHNTYSDWRVYGGAPNEGECVAEFNGNCSIQWIKVYTAPNTGSNPYQGKLKIQYQSNNNWLDIPGVNIDLSRMTKGWQSFDIGGGNITTAKLRVALVGQQAMGGIKEVEIWGYPRAVTGSYYFYSSGAPVTLSSDPSGSGANYSFQLTDTGSGAWNLHLAGNGGSPDLTWELNGYPMGSLSASSLKNGTAFYHVPIDARRLQTGTNYIRINGSGLTLTDCRIEKTADYTLEGGNSGLTDRWLLTAAADAENLIDLGSNFHLDQLILQYMGNRPAVQIAVLQKGQWLTLSGPSADSSDSLGGQLIYSGIGQATQIRVSYDSGSADNSLGELMIYGSAINDGAPTIQITAPLDGDVFTLSQWGQGKFRAMLDNPDVTLKLNGQVTYFTGTAIVLPLPQLGNPQGEQVIKAEVTDSQGRSGCDTITISVSTPPDFTVNLPEGITYTREAQITVSGAVIIPTSRITINGVAVTVQNNRFSTVYPLKEGLNLLTIKLVPSAGSTQVNTLFRKVVRASGAPYLKVLNPADGEVTSAAQISVSGEVSSLLPVTVTVNGKAATLKSGSFTSSPVSLAEGSNKLTVIAKDQNGLTSQAVLTIRRDSAKPVLSGITPAEGAYLNALTVKVSGTISDASPVSVLVNGVAATVSVSDSDKQFSTTVTVSEGANILKIQATDSAGNSATATRNVFVDTGAPADFTPVANISGWSNNSKPTITFNTTDSGSGIDHYEIGVDGVTSSSRAVSPYTFTTAIAEGEHTVQVKAVDRAGNYTTGEVKVYIDTVAPITPANFEAISGINRVILQWEDDGGEVRGYRITRTTPFSGGGYVELFRESELHEVAQYLDSDVSSGVSYSYTIQAIDRAGNYSTATAKLTAATGDTTQAIDSQGGTVKFDNCTLTLPESAITTAGRIVMQQTSETLPDNVYGTKTGSAYSFTLLDSSGAEVETEFTELPTLTISYADMEIPSGFDEADFGIYWYNKAGGYWEKLDYAFNNIIRKTITVKLHHFSDYQVMASKYNSPSQDSYYGMGVSPFLSYFQNNVESVSPSTGSLTMNATDLKLPGRGGFDLVIKRIYDTTAAIQERYMASNAIQDYSTKAPIDTFGCGWSLAIPWIETSDKGKYLRLPEGQTIMISLNSSYVFEYHKGVHFILKKDKITGSYSLTMNDGTKFEFDSAGRVITQTDPTGINVITFAYNVGNSRQLATITDSIGRVVTFRYKTIGSKSVIDYITTGAASENVRKITYKYNNGDDALTDVYDPLGRRTIYAYESHTFKGGYSNKSDDWYDETFTYSVDLLNSITYPTGEKSNYVYGFGNQKYEEKIKAKVLGFISVTIAEIKYYGTKVFISSHSVGGKETVYSYKMNSQRGSFDDKDFVPAYTYMNSFQCNEGNKISQGTFKPIEGSALVDVVKDLDKLQGILMIQNQVTIDDNQLVERITYEHNVPLRAITQESHYRGGNIIYSITIQYDEWGNPIYQYDSSRSLEQDWSYYKQDTLSIKNLVATHKRMNKNPIENTTATVTTSYTYDDNLGKLLTETVNDGQKDRLTRFTYDNKGNLKTKTEEFRDNLKMEIFYDDSYQAFPVKQIIYGILDADGNSTDLVTKADYNPETGLKLSETDARGFITSYEYDKLNRVIKVTLPDDDTNDSNNPYREYIFDDENNTYILYNENRQKTTFKFDGLGRMTDVIKDSALYSSGVTTSYQYNTMGQIDQVTDERGNITTYLYDGLNRVTKVTYPGGAYVTLKYTDDTNSVTITDENGGVIAEQKDWADRLTLAKQYCSFEGSTDIYGWQYTYDSLGNRLRQTDPKSNQTDQVFDTLGRLTSVLMPTAPVILPGATAVTNYQPTLNYEYNLAGFKTAEISANENAKSTPNKTGYEYDPLGRVVKTTTRATDVFTGQTLTTVTKTYYDAAGNKVKIVDPNGGISEFTYSARGYLLTQRDPEGNVTRYQYDALGNKTAVTDPRGNGADGSFTAYYQYDDLNRLSKTILPDNTPSDLSDNPYTLVTYDEAGNKLTERDPNGVVTSYTYTVRNWVETVSLNGERKTKYVYDTKGNQIEIHDALGNVTQNDYDSLGRVRRVTQKGTATITELYSYDEMGNRTAVVDGRNNTTKSTYNGLGWLTSVRDPLLNVTQYFYDPNGNQVKVITANGLTLKNSYDELNRLIGSTDSLEHSTQYSYDLAGNKQQILDRRGTTWVYQYTPNNLMKRLDLTGADGSRYYVEYTYDAAGNCQQVTDSGNIVQYNFVDGAYQADPLNRLNSVDRSFDGATYRTAYQYDNAGLLTKIKYPETAKWLQYNYNNLNQLSTVTGFTSSITYDANGALTGLTYANGVTASYSYDNNNRLKDYQVTLNGTSILQQRYTYDNNSNITAITEGSNTKTFDYDANDQLTRSVTPGKFLESDSTSGSYGIKIGDYLGAKIMDFTPVLTAMMGLDYNSSSIGIDFGTTASGVKKIQVIPDGKFTVHRVTQRSLDLYTSADNSTYTIIPRTSWTFATDSKGVITITLNERVATRYLKVHVKFDERDSYFNPKSKATFLNDFAKMLRIYQEATSRTEEFRYDAAGNRTYQQVTLIQSNSYSSSYYTNSDRLKTDGKYAFAYDDAGNLVKKGNKFTISGDTVLFTTSGDGVEYWEYQYNLLNQLISVTKNATIVAEYAYDPEGLRVVKKAKGETTHYVFEGTEPVFEKKISSGKIKSYVYALGKHLARVDGVIGDSSAKVYYYHTDQVGSVRVITDQNGTTVFNADYLAFGAKFISNGDFDETHGFTGKEYDSDTWLYYYNARWYDSELGRFISEDDPAADPNNPNLYSYCGNNSLNRIDPSGQCPCLIALAWSALLAGIAKTAAGISTWENGGTFWSGYCGEPISIGASTNGTQARPYLGKEYGFADIDIGNTGDINYGGVSYSGYSDRYLRDDYNIEEQDYLEPYHLPKAEDFKPSTDSSSFVGSPAPTNIQKRSHGVSGSWSYGASGSWEASNSNTILDWIQTGLDVVGLIPGPGEIVDGVNGLISLGRGDYVNAGLSAAAMIPFAGWGSTGGKMALKHGDEAIVIGESMEKRVIPFAKEIGAKYYKPTSKIAENWMKNNKRWLLKQIREGKKIIDIGIDTTRTVRSDFYKMEKTLLEKLGYPVTKVKKL